MSYAPAPAAPRNGHRPALLGIGLAGAALFALVQAGVVAPPDLEGALTDLSDSLGPWTYALVAALAFLETGAFVGLIAPGETAVVLGGVVAAEGGVDLSRCSDRLAAAALGDLACFALGRRLGRRFLVAHGPRHRGHTAAAGARRRLLRPPRRQGDPDRALHRPGPRGRAVPGGRVGMRLRAFLPWCLLGTAAWASDLHAGRLRLPRFLQDGRRALTHAAFALAIVAALVFAWRAHRRSRTPTFARNR